MSYSLTDNGTNISKYYHNCDQSLDIETDTRNWLVIAKFILEFSKLWLMEKRIFRSFDTLKTIVIWGHQIADHTILYGTNRLSLEIFTPPKKITEIPLKQLATWKRYVIYSFSHYDRIVSTHHFILSVSLSVVLWPFLVVNRQFWSPEEARPFPPDSQPDSKINKITLRHDDHSSISSYSSRQMTFSSVNFVHENIFINRMD
jgi:hypothetical protein